ncbi:DoxX family protein [Actinomycetospora straminea]|uniref:DoxX-like protein n=1 Tax=Actinomycetospora straminea TaxID=663607 RepID=A0ABP9ELQ5_9PSEU|nr:DoxX family protein [Actinomycetospora straminea]MDD7934986.1 DoxX family protein [Actinomycetospora straminea]
MDIAHLAVTLLTIAANAFAAGADFARAPFVLRTSASVGVPVSWLTPLGLLKAAGALGLVVGLLGVPALGTAAATGLVLFFVSAVAAHLRAGDHTAAVAVPASFLALAAVSLVSGLLVA